MSRAPTKTTKISTTGKKSQRGQREVLRALTHTPFLYFHSRHERILDEKMLRAVESQPPVSQPAAVSYVLYLIGYFVVGRDDGGVLLCRQHEAKYDEPKAERADRGEGSYGRRLHSSRGG
jgi:hypothetical protein